MSTPSFDKFGKQFQIKLFHYIITDPDFSSQLMEVIKPSYFSNENYSLLMSMIEAYYNEYHAIPSFDNLETVIRTEIVDSIQLEFLLEFLASVKEQPSITDREFIEDKALEFCKQQAMVNAIQFSIPLIKQERYEEIYAVIQDALNAGSTRDIGHDYIEMALSRKMARRFPVSTGFPLIDKHLSGGLGAGELGVILAGTGVGKSMVLSFIAAEALKAGLNVVYYTLELSDQMVALRMDSRISGVNLSNLLSDSDGEYRERVNSKLKAIEKKNGRQSKCIIREYATKTASIATFRNHINQLRHRGFVPDMVIVDYADIMKPISHYKEKRYELESNVEQLRGLAGELKIPIWTASQTNRSGLETSIVTLTSVSESLAKAMVADVILSIGRDMALSENNEACYYLAKNRFGRDKIAFTGKFDTSFLNFTVDREGVEIDQLEKQDVDARRTAIGDAVSKLFT